MVMSSKKIGRMVDADVGKALANISATTKPDMKGGDEEFKKATGPSRDLTRGEAFKLARMKAKLAGEDPSKATFTWGGKTYHTRMAGEGGSKAATPKAATPKAAAPKAATTKAPEVNARTKEFFSKLPLLATRDMRSIQNKPTGSTKDNSFAARQTRKYGDSSPGNVLRAIKDIKDFNDAGLKRDVITDAKFKARQKAKGYAKGGSVDGIAIRGKTRAPMKKGK